MKIGSTLVCPQCRIVFVKVTAHTTYCSRDCQRKSYNTTQRTTRILELKICDVCTQEFSTKEKKQVHCSSTCNRRFNLIRTAYKLDPNTVRTIFAQQGNKCAICDSGAQNWWDLNIDHCHTSGKVRGLLCTHCNFILGHAFDTPRILDRAITYLGGKGKTVCV